MLRLDFGQQSHAVLLLQPDVQHDQVHLSLIEETQRFLRSGGGGDAVTLAGEVNRQQLADLQFVIDDQNVLAHTSGQRSNLCTKFRGKARDWKSKIKIKIMNWGERA